MFRKRTICFSLILIILIISIGAVSAQDNSTQTHTDEGKTFTDIKIAIDKASENDTIELEGTYYSEGKEIEINKSITITSKNGATLDAKFKSNILNISNVNVYINNINFINSQSKTTAAIYSQGNLTLTDSKFINNTIKNPDKISSFLLDDISRSAGALHSTNYATIINCEFEDNYDKILVYHYEYFEEYTDYMIAHNLAKGYKDNLHFLSMAYFLPIAKKTNIPKSKTPLKHTPLRTKGLAQS